MNPKHTKIIIRVLTLIAIVGVFGAMIFGEQLGNRLSYTFLLVGFISIVLTLVIQVIERRKELLTKVANGEDLGALKRPFTNALKFIVLPVAVIFAILIIAAIIVG